MSDMNEWWAREDSNLQPDRYERSALTIELRALKTAKISSPCRQNIAFPCFFRG